MLVFGAAGEQLIAAPGAYIHTWGGWHEEVSSGDPPSPPAAPRPRQPPRDSHVRWTLATVDNRLSQRAGSERGSGRRNPPSLHAFPATTRPRSPGSKWSLNTSPPKKEQNDMAASAADRPRPGTAPGTRTASGTGTAPRPRGGAATQPPRSPGGGVPQRRGSPPPRPVQPAVAASLPPVLGFLGAVSPVRGTHACPCAAWGRHAAPEPLTEGLLPSSHSRERAAPAGSGRDGEED